MLERVVRSRCGHRKSKDTIMAKKKTFAPLKFDATATRLAKAGRISTKALKRYKVKTGKLAKRGSAIAITAPRGGVAKGMAGM